MCRPKFMTINTSCTCVNLSTDVDTQGLRNRSPWMSVFWSISGPVYRYLYMEITNGCSRNILTVIVSHARWWGFNYDACFDKWFVSNRAGSNDPVLQNPACMWQILWAVKRRSLVRKKSGSRWCQPFVWTESLWTVCLCGCRGDAVVRKVSWFVHDPPWPY